MRKEAIYFGFLILLSVFIAGIVSASTLPIYVKPLAANGSLNPSTTYNYTFTWTTNSSCSNIIFSQNKTITTGKDGVGFANLTLPQNMSSIPTYLCEYMSGNLISVNQLSGEIFNRVYTQTLNTSGNVYSNGNIYTAGNISTSNYGFFSYLGSLATKIATIFAKNIFATNITADVIGNNSTIYYGNGSSLKGITATVAPAGNNGAIQYNDQGSTGGNASALSFNKTTSTLSINGSFVINGVNWSAGHGAIIASGNNSNGYYIQYADGTMIEWGTTSGCLINNSYSNYYYCSLSVSVPISFSQVPDVHATGIGAAPYSVHPNTLTVSGFNIEADSVNSVYGTNSINWYALGRWTNLNLGTGEGGNSGIVNTITNGNGTCIQYSNGIMECYGNATSGPNSQNPINLPSPYVNTNYVALGMLQTGAVGTSYAQASSVTRTRTNFTIYLSTGTSYPFVWYSIGRWTNSTNVNTPDISTWGLDSKGNIVQVNSSRNITISGILNVSQICLAGVCHTSWPTGGSGGQAYNQVLNTTSNVTFNHINVTNGLNVNGSLIVNGANWSAGHGAIIASGNNSNGYYIQYADGTMIEWGSATASMSSTTKNQYGNNSGTTYYGDYTINYPISFEGFVPKPLLTVDDAAMTARYLVGSAGTSSFTAQIFNGAQSSAQFGWVSVGRWTNLNLGTGAGGNSGIVNTITNSNGTCTQYSNGIMACNGYNLSCSFGTNQAVTFTFPTPFVNNWASGLSFQYSITSNAGYMPTSYIANDYPTTTQAQVVYTLSSSSTVCRIAYHAVGKWTNSTNINTPDYSTFGINAAGNIVQVNSSKNVNITGKLYVQGVQVTGSGGGQAYNQVLNTTSNVTFNNVNVTNTVQVGSAKIFMQGSNMIFRI